MYQITTTTNFTRGLTFLHYNGFFVAPNSDTYTTNQFREKMLPIVLTRALSPE